MGVVIGVLIAVGLAALGVCLAAAGLTYVSEDDDDDGGDED